MTGVSTARELRNRVAVRFGKRSEVLSFPEHVVLYEVPFLGRAKYGLREGEVLEELGKNMRSRQRFDALAIGVWPSSKGLVHGFELKVSRSDLLHELRDLTKSETAARNVDRFWLVLGDKSLMKDTDPIPESWGILYASGKGLRLLRDAQPQEGFLSRSLVTGIATRALITPRIGNEVRYRDGLMVANRYRDEFYSQRNRDRAEAAERDAFVRKHAFEEAATLVESFSPALAVQLRSRS